MMMRWSKRGYRSSLSVPNFCAGRRYAPDVQPVGAVSPPWLPLKEEEWRLSTGRNSSFGNDCNG